MNYQEYASQITAYRDQVADLIKSNEWLKEQLLRAAEERQKLGAQLKQAQPLKPLKAIRKHFTPIRSSVKALKNASYKEGLREGMKQTRRGAFEHGRKQGLILGALCAGAVFGIFFFVYKKVQKHKIKKLKKEVRRAKREGAEDYSEE